MPKRRPIPQRQIVTLAIELVRNEDHSPIDWDQVAEELRLYMEDDAADVFVGDSEHRITEVRLVDVADDWK